jgi:hypothetical protein
MPTAVITFIGSVAGAIVTGLTAVGFSTAAAVTILDIGIKLAALAGLAKLSESLFGEDIPPTPAENFQVTKRSTLEYQRIVYGETLMSGPIVYLNSAGDHNTAPGIITRIYPMQSRLRVMKYRPLRICG